MTAALVVCLVVSALCLPINASFAVIGNARSAFFAGINVMTIAICIAGLT